MERALIQKILADAHGIERGDDGAFNLEGEHRASLYLGGEGGTTIVNDLVTITLHDDYIAAEAKNRTMHCLLYGPVIGLAVKRPRAEGPRTGF
ncbi:MAG: hypothetical protein H6719_02205 [Sandaracinaceae bacterium]|nr:hypothetical protein [Sandaracinaceae bacterium]